MIYTGDCLDIMRGMEADGFDAVVTDPPYCSGSVSEATRTAAKGQGLRSGTINRLGWFVGDNMGTAGLAFLLRSVAFESLRLVKSSGHFLCFCDWRMVATLAPAIESAGWRYQNLVVWDKGHMGLGRGFRAQHELVLHFTAGKPEYHDRATSNVLTAKRVHATKRVHQTEKPVELLQKLVRVVTPDGGTVLDPFAGSGSTGLACVAEGREFVGIERNPDHAQLANSRLGCPG